MDTNQIPESYKFFKKRFDFQMEKARESDCTIFTESEALKNIPEEVILEHYSYFNKNYRLDYNQATDYNSRNKVFDASIQESFFQDNFNKVLDASILSGRITISQEVILENTVTQFNLDLDKVGKDFNPSNSSGIEVIQENVFGHAAGVVAGAVGGLGVGILVAGVTSFALGMIMPARYTNNVNQTVNELAGKVLGAVMGAYSILDSKFAPSLSQSHQNIIKFDNINADKSVQKLFVKIQKSGLDVKEAKNGLDVLMAECVAANRDIFSLANDTDKGMLGNLLNGDFNPQKYNIFKLIYKSFMGSANSNKSDYNTLLRFRKCVATKLVDVYKLLLISNLQSRNDHKKILDSISKAGTGRSENLLSFISSTEDKDKKLKESILALMEFRIYLTKLAEDMKHGAFDVDTEAGTFLLQKLSSVDTDVENYLRLNQQRNQDNVESNFGAKNTFAKRSLLSNSSNL